MVLVAIAVAMAVWLATNWYVFFQIRWQGTVSASFANQTDPNAPISAHIPKADICSAIAHVRFVPEADIA